MIDISQLFPDRSETKQTINKLHDKIETLSADLELDKANLYNRHNFSSKLSDLKGRNLEFKKACKDDPDINAKESELRSLQADLRDKERVLSEINYEQRERMIDGMSTLAGVVRQFIDAVNQFNQAVDKLVESRKK